MSIQSEITRITNNVDLAKQAIVTKNVTVPEGSTSDNLAELILRIKTITDDVLIVHGDYSETDGWTADCGYNQIIHAQAGTGVPLNEFVISRDIVGGYGIPMYVFLIMRDGTNVRLGALFDFDQTNHYAIFALGNNVAKIDSSATITIE